MLSGHDSVDSNSHPSGAEVLLTACASESHTPDTEYSHDFEACAGGQAYGQGAPVYPCGCYQYSKRYSSFYEVEPLQELEPPEVADALSEAGQRMIEQVCSLKIIYSGF